MRIEIVKSGMNFTSKSPSDYFTGRDLRWKIISANEEPNLENSQKLSPGRMKYSDVPFSQTAFTQGEYII